MRRLLVLVVLTVCSSRDSPPPPSSDERPPVLDEAQKQAVVREIVKQASAENDARTTSCELPATIERAEVTGTASVTELDGKTIHLAVGDLEGGLLALHAGASIQAGRTNLRARRDADDFDRPIVFELSGGVRALDAAAGTLVIDSTKPVLAGHLENADFRERREDFTYVTNGCTTRVGRIDFRFDTTAR